MIPLACFNLQDPGPNYLLLAQKHDLAIPSEGDLLKYLQYLAMFQSCVTLWVME